MAETNGSVTYGPGFATLLTLLFIGLKLTGYITWSWVWVLAPLWISAIIAVGIIGVVLYALVKYEK